MRSPTVDCCARPQWNSLGATQQYERRTFSSEFARRWRETRYMLGTRRTREPSWEGVAQHRFTLLRSLTSPVDDQHAAQASRSGARDSISHDSVGIVSADAMEIDAFFGRGLAPTEGEKLCVTHPRSGCAMKLIGIRPPESLRSL